MGDCSNAGISQIDQNKENICADNSLDENLKSSIIRQCEFYFSDANILRDQFLLKLVKASEDGWVNLKVVSNFKKMKSLCKDYDVIVKALLGSTRIEVSECNNLIRRRDPLPEWNKHFYRSSIIISDFPKDIEFTLESISTFFKDSGYTPILVRILKPKGKIPPDLKRWQSSHSHFGTSACAVVELADRQSAQMALLLVRKTWPNIYAELLTNGNNKSGKSKTNSNDGQTQVASNIDSVGIPKFGKKKSKSKVDHPKLLTGEGRPMLNFLNLTENKTHMIHIRQPFGPPNSECIGFVDGWRDQLRLEQMNVTN